MRTTSSVITDPHWVNSLRDFFKDFDSLYIAVKKNEGYTTVSEADVRKYYDADDQKEQDDQNN